MAEGRLLWVDIGMAIAVGGFIAIVVFLRDAEYFVPVMFAFAIVLVAWALIAEYALVRHETAERDELKAAARRMQGQPLPH